MQRCAFLYVPCKPSRTSCKLVYVPMRSKCVLLRTAHVALPPNLRDGTRLPICLDPPTQLPCGHPTYVPIRSGIRSYTFQMASHLHSVRSYRIFVPASLFLCGHIHYVPIRSAIRSYTFRTTSPLSCCWRNWQSAPLENGDVWGYGVERKKRVLHL